MSELTLWKEKEIGKLKREIEYLFERCWTNLGMAVYLERISDSISVETAINGDTFVVKAVVPGADIKDLTVHATPETLTIKASRSEAAYRNGPSSQRVEKRISEVSREIPFPFQVNVDQVRAILHKDILTVLAPRWVPPKGRTIQIELG